MSVQTLNNSTLKLRSLNISNEYLQNSQGYIPQENVLTTANNGDLLVNGIPIQAGGGGGGIIEILDGPGISSTETEGVVTINNTGVLSIVAGTNVTISETEGAVTINSTGGGGGGAVNSVTAGVGIGVLPTTGDVIVSNDGVLALTAGSGISISGTNADKTITNNGVLSIVAGTNVTISETEGAVTINAIGGGSAANINGYRYTNTTTPFYFEVATNTSLSHICNFTNFNVSATSVITCTITQSNITGATLPPASIAIPVFSNFSYTNAGADSTVTVNYAMICQNTSIATVYVNSIELLVYNP